jgi:hypothetical protein
MNLYRVYNGYTGFSAVHTLVTAECEQGAVDLARPVFKREQANNPGYSEKLDAELVFTDVTKAQCSDVMD